MKKKLKIFIALFLLLLTTLFSSSCFLSLGLVVEEEIRRESHRMDCALIGEPQMTVTQNEKGVYEVTVECDSTACAFLPGHAIRVEIAGSDFPRYDRNLHTGESPLTGTAMRTAHMELVHDKAHPSQIILPVLPED